MQFTGFLTNGRFSIIPEESIVYSYPVDSFRVELDTLKEIRSDILKIDLSACIDSLSEVSAKVSRVKKVKAEVSSSKIYISEVKKV
jgi:hypothetical protein